MPTLQTTPIRLVPDDQLPSFEALDSRPLYGLSELFPSPMPNELASSLQGYDTRAEPLTHVSTLDRLTAGLRALRTQTLAQREISGHNDDTDKTLRAINVQEVLVWSINGAIDYLRRDGWTVLDATYAVDDYVERRDQQMRDGYSAQIAADSQLFYALQNGGELRLPGPVEEMILDPRDEMARLEGNVMHDRLAIERLDFEWVSAAAILEAVRKDARSDPGINMH